MDLCIHPESLLMKFLNSVSSILTRISLSRRLRQSEEMLVKKQEYLEKQIEDQLAIIRQNGTKNKRISMQALKRKKRLEQQLTQNDGKVTCPGRFR